MAMSKDDNTKKNTKCNGDSNGKDNTKYSLVHLTSAASTPDELIRLAADTGFDCVGLRSIPTRTSQRVDSVRESVTGRSPFALADDRELLLRTKRASEETGVIINDVENARIFEGCDVRRYERDLNVTAELGITQVLTNIWVPDHGFAMEQFCRLCELARPYGIDINLEIVTWSVVPGIREAAAFLREAAQPNQGIVLDTIHFYRSGNTPADLDGLPAAWFKYIHMCDAPREIPQGEELIRTGLEERLIPGEGAVGIREILEKLPPVVRGLEIPHKMRIRDQGITEYLRNALIQTKAYLEGLQ